jgi:acetyl-CoA carboxylase beta subunit
MREGALSLMQMAKTTQGLLALDTAGLLQQSPENLYRIWSG